MYQKNPFEDLPEGLSFDINPYAKELYEARKDASVPAVFGQELKEYTGCWKRRLSSETLMLEIGVHKGATLLELARTQAGLGCVGMDITFKRVMTTAKRLQEEGLGQKAAAVLADARFLDQVFAPDELDGVIMFFPDPWTHKKGYTHKRLFQDDLCVAIKRALNCGGYFWFKTDCGDYSQHTAQILESHGFRRQESVSPYDEDYSSSFERKFRGKGLPIYNHWWIPPVS
ncbi:MAG: tRNA (guanosine(46)-N(7))-methyltransferase TrmB [Oligoflexales bacterium]